MYTFGGTSLSAGFWGQVRKVLDVLGSSGNHGRTPTEERRDGTGPPLRVLTAARQQFKAVLDAAEAGLVTTVTRGDEKYLVVPARQLRDELAHLRPSRAEVLAEGGGWAVILPGLPVHGDGETFDSALDDAIVALREYAEDWNERLRSAPNQRPAPACGRRS